MLRNGAQRDAEIHHEMPRHEENDESEDKQKCDEEEKVGGRHAVSVRRGGLLKPGATILCSAQMGRSTIWTRTELSRSLAEIREPPDITHA